MTLALFRSTVRDVAAIGVDYNFVTSLDEVLNS